MRIPSLLLGRVEDWGTAPSALGLRIDERGALLGAWQGRIELCGLHTHRIVRERNERIVQYYTELSARIDPPLNMSLRVRRRGVIDRAATNLFGQDDVQLGHLELDRALEVRGRETEHVRRLLADDEVLRMLTLATLRPHFWISDGYVAVVHEGHYERDVEALRTSFEAAARLADVLGRRRATELAHWELELRPAWATIAAAWGLAFDGPRATLSGVVRGREITVQTLSREERLMTQVRIGLRRAAGVGLSLTRQNGDGFFSRLFRGQDVVTGDAAFDAAFVVRGEPEDAVRALLGPEARARLMGVLTKNAALSVEDGVLVAWAAAPIHSAAHVDDLLKSAFLAAEALG